MTISGMTRPILLILAASMAAPWVASPAVAAGPERKYMSVSKCGPDCHDKVETGDQQRKWAESAHAKAYQTLGTDKAKEVAKKAGVKTPPQKTEKCLKCHVTAFGVKPELIHKNFRIEDGVQCESCHGAGGEYYMKEIMEIPGESLKYGLIIPNEKTCAQCHNKDAPTWDPKVGFNAKEAFKKIDHRKPERLNEEWPRK